MKVLLIILFPVLLFAQQRQNLSYEPVAQSYAHEQRTGYFQTIDTLDILTYQAWNPARTMSAKLVMLTDLPQGLGGRVLTFVRDDTIIVEPDTIRFARFTFRGKKQIRQNFTMIRVSASSYDLFNSKGRLIRREFVGDPELVFKDARFRKDRALIKNKIKKKKKRIKSDGSPNSRAAQEHSRRAAA